MSRSIVTPIGRASFPHLAKPNQYDKYAITLLLPKNDPKVQEFMQWLKTAVTEEAMTVAGPEGFAAAMRDFEALKDGDNTSLWDTYRAEYAGHWVLTLGRKTEFGRPSVVNRNKQPIDPGEIYAGANVIVFIDVFGYVYGNKKSVTIGFQHVLKVGENTRFAASGIAVDKAFEGLVLPEVADTVPANPFGAPPQVPGYPPQPVYAPQPVPAPAAPVATPPNSNPFGMPPAPKAPNNPFSGV